MLIQTNFIAGKMNKSVDERLVPVGEYVDALNVRLGSTEGTEVGAVENSKGNTNLTPNIEYNGNPLSANARCVGAFEDGIAETIYWFVYDPGDPEEGQVAVDMILSYNTNTNTLLYHVVSTSVLNFNPTYLVNAVNKIEDLLFFTDDLNPPRYINVTRTYPVPGQVPSLTEEDISVILKPPGYETISTVTLNNPLRSPFVELSNQVDFQGDYLEMRFLRFAYRYRYLDEGYSATSLFSNPAFEPKTFAFSNETFKNVGMVNRFNTAQVYFSTGSRRVKEIQLLYKDTTSNNIFIVKTYNKQDLGIPDDSYFSQQFDNSKILTLLGSDELLRLYDNVPRIAKAQTIQGNRLMYGNYVDQYDITNREEGDLIQMDYWLNADSQELGVSDFPTPEGSSGTYSIDPAGAGTVIPDATIGFDLSSITEDIVAGTTFRFQLALQNVQSARSGSAQQPAATVIPSFGVTLTFVASQTYTSVNQMLSSQEFAAAVGSDNTFLQLIPYTTPAPPSYPPTVNPASLGTTLTDVFNNSLPYAWQNGTDYLLLVDTAISNTCAVTGMTPFPPTAPVCTQQSFELIVAGSTFTLQAPAATYYFNSTPTETIQYEYLAFNLGSSGGFMQTLPTSGSLHSHRDYEVGVVYMDDYGRSSTVLTSQNNSIFFPASTSVFQNKIQVQLQNLAPYWAKFYKFVVKPTQGLYNTIWSTMVFQQSGSDEGPEPFIADSESYWFRLEGDSQNIVSVGDVLTVKRDANGAVGAFLTAEVLDKEAIYSQQINSTNPAGIYMRLKASGWATEGNNAQTNISSNDTVTNTNGQVENCDDINDLVPATSPPISGEVPAGSTVRVRIHNSRTGTNNIQCTDRVIIWDSGDQLVNETYANIRVCLIQLGFPQLCTANQAEQNVGEMGLEFDSGEYNNTEVVPVTCFNSKVYVTDDGAGNFRIKNKSGIPTCTQLVFQEKESVTRLEVTINYSSGTFCFETEPAAVDPNLFYDASDMTPCYTSPLDGNSYHVAAQEWAAPNGPYSVVAGGQTQGAGVPLLTTLDFYNCYAFGNGVESFRIEDRINGKYFLLGDRVMAESNETFSEADRFAGMTYSGVYSNASNLNNLNEFNLGLVNYKDLETNFGPIQVLHSRETDILVLQEDRISYVLAGKNVITDSTGGGAIASVPEVLGTQIARIEEYGISFNPESFSAWGHNVFFTDTKRSAVLSLTGGSTTSDQLQVISQMGMRSWFRDQFTEQLTTQKLGGYDPYMNEYVLGTNNIAVPMPLVELPCGQEISQNATNQTLSFTVNFGQIIGQVDIPYVISQGSINLSVTWNGSITSTGVVSTNGTLSFNKTSANPATATVVIEASSAGLPGNVPATYSLVPGCPPKQKITLIQVVVNGNNYINESIHYGFDWSDGVTTSPISSTPVIMGGGVATSAYLAQTGNVSQGIFPYDGANITLRTTKIPPDDFSFNPTLHKFRILSSNTLYSNNAADISSLLAVPPSVVTPITNPSTPVYEATETAFSMPGGNAYLYLVWDFRNATGDQLCYSATSSNDACCNCTTACSRCWFSPVQSSQPSACAVDTNSFGSNQLTFTGAGLIPAIGDIVYAVGNVSCQPSVGLGTSGFYIVDPAQPSGANPKNWIEVGPGGIVTNSGTC